MRDTVTAGPGPTVPDPAAPDTGHPAVDDAVAAVQRVSHLSPAEQIPAYQAAFRTLQETLASVDV